MPAFEFLALANHAEAREGLLYLSGVGWSDFWRGVTVPEGPQPMTHFGIGVSMLVPWGETNRRHHLIIRLESEDGGELARAEADVEMGRPPGSTPGADLRAVLALNIDTVFPGPGRYRVVGELGEDVRTVPFSVHDEPLPGSPPVRAAG